MVENNPSGTKPRPRALGRGLESLLPATPAVPPQPVSLLALAAEEAPTRWVAVSLIDDNPMQTRMAIDQAALEELKRSIAEQGLLQPILVRPTANGRFHVMGGQRRLLAVRELGHEKVQAHIKPASDESAFLYTIGENLQRQDLDPIEQAHAFARLSRDFGYAQKDIADKVGKSREAVTNSIRLLQLPTTLQRALVAKQITIGHAKALLMLDDQTAMGIVGARVIAQQLSVRKTEEAVHQVKYGKPAPAPKSVAAIDPNVRAAQDALQRALGLKVSIEYRNGKGRVIVQFRSLDDFQVLMDSLGPQK